MFSFPFVWAWPRSLRGSEELPEAIAGPTPFKLERAPIAASKSFLLKMALNAFLLSCKTTLGVFIWIKSFSRGRKTPRWVRKLIILPPLKCNYWLSADFWIGEIVNLWYNSLAHKHDWLNSPPISTWWSEQAPRVWHAPLFPDPWFSLASHFGTCNSWMLLKENLWETSVGKLGQAPFPLQSARWETRI